MLWLWLPLPSESEVSGFARTGKTCVCVPSLLLSTSLDHVTSISSFRLSICRSSVLFSILHFFLPPPFPSIGSGGDRLGGDIFGPYACQRHWNSRSEHMDAIALLSWWRLVANCHYIVDCVNAHCVTRSVRICNDRKNLFMRTFASVLGIWNARPRCKQTHTRRSSLTGGWSGFMWLASTVSTTPALFKEPNLREKYQVK